ncbi:hypothetical protein F4781DRAFT_76890 [Annulohypoxylon bovei var. microspora]|nr:hypothetical protein F4781DRAFT_76890 [Annulohypoxylon bovei var. microspora]
MQATPEYAFLYISPIGYRKSSNCGYCRRKGLGQSQWMCHIDHASISSRSNALVCELT